jgi:hypothetical protein
MVEECVFRENSSFSSVGSECSQIYISGCNNIVKICQSINIDGNNNILTNSSYINLNECSYCIVQNIAGYSYINIDNRYDVLVREDSNGQVKIWNPADLVTD